MRSSLMGRRKRCDDIDVEIFMSIETEY